jgi:uncharacterized membrane protein SpoIIM required for sporulation/ABC-type transport system involved in multi-copper enzyme maturation permease subunit
MLDSFRVALIVTKREVRDQFRDWRIIIPIVVLTIIFPALMNFTAKQVVDYVQQHGAPVIGDRLIPFLLMIVGFFPISVSLVIALESFVGEKERHSIEPLLCSPLDDWQLYIGKLLACIFPSLLASYLGIGVYLVGIYRQVGWTPGLVLLVQILALTTVQALVMVSGAVVVSSQTTSVRAANLLASFIIIPMTFLIQGESVVMFWADYDVLWLAVFGQIIIASLLVRTGISHFNREELLSRELDTLNLRRAWRVFWTAFKGQALSPINWFRHEIPPTLKRLGLPSLLAAISILAGLYVGAAQIERFALPIGVINIENLKEGFVKGLETIRFLSSGNVPLIWFHNLRAIVLATVLGIFSFGVLGLIILMFPLVIIGYFTAAAAQAGISPWLFLTALVLPHGLLEVPAMILAGAAILRLGATLAAPAQGRTISEAWLYALADWSKVMVAIVVPLLLGAAAIEVFITPRLALLVFGN